ncbi:MAG: PEGA domain-containing protein [Methanoregula sp.]|nr:PEGA domain-containing protein [Methanoregula sp.]
MTPLPEKTGTVKITSSPSGAEIYLDNEYHGTTPGTITEVAPGNHTIEIRKQGYNEWSQSITVISGINSSVSTTLVPVFTNIPTTVPVITETVAKKDVPQIHIDGYWTWPAIRSYSNPEPVLVHVEGANVGYTDAREVTTSANMYFEGRQICWTKVYLGTIKSGGHVTIDTMMYCSLPSDEKGQNLKIMFENVIINQ